MCSKNQKFSCLSSFSSFFSMYVLCVSCKYWDKDYWKVVGRWKESCVVLSKCGLREREEEKKEGDEEWGDVFPLVWSLVPTANIDVVQIYTLTLWCSIGIGWLCVWSSVVILEISLVCRSTAVVWRMSLIYMSLEQQQQELEGSKKWPRGFALDMFYSIKGGLWPRFWRGQHSAAAPKVELASYGPLLFNAFAKVHLCMCIYGHWVKDTLM